MTYKMSYANGNFQTKPFSSAKFFNFKKSVNDLDLDAVTTNPYSLRRKCNNAPFVEDTKNIVKQDPWIYFY